MNPGQGRGQPGPRSANTVKVAFPVHKRGWHPSVLPGPIVLISTVDAAGEPNIAPRSFVSMMAFGGPVLAFGCHRSHATARNARAAGQFVVNFPPEALAERIWAMPTSHGAERIARSGLSLLPARSVAPPLIAECKAHLECMLRSVVRLGAEVVVFGTIVAGAIDQDCLGPGVADQYFRLRPVFFLEEGVYGSIDAAKRSARPARPTSRSRSWNSTTPRRPRHRSAPGVRALAAGHRGAADGRAL